MGRAAPQAQAGPLSSQLHLGAGSGPVRLTDKTGLDLVQAIEGTALAPCSGDLLLGEAQDSQARPPSWPLQDAPLGPWSHMRPQEGRAPRQRAGPPGAELLGRPNQSVLMGTGFDSAETFE